MALVGKPAIFQFCRVQSLGDYLSDKSSASLCVFDGSSVTHHNIVEIFNIKGIVMSTVNFSVPEDIKNAFNTVFEGQNKSAVIADLMRDAVEREQRRRQHCSAVDRILANRINAPRFSEAEFRAAREEGRP
jgi:hypothetical protein